MRPSCGSSARLASTNGAGEQPQLPATMVVMPCSSSGASTSAWSGCGITQSLCECMSMNPGATTRPRQSSDRAAAAPERSPTAAMRPSRTPTDAATPSLPVPSSTVPPCRRRSNATRQEMHEITRLWNARDRSGWAPPAPRHARASRARRPVRNGLVLPREGTRVVSTAGLGSAHCREGRHRPVEGASQGKTTSSAFASRGAAPPSIDGSISGASDA